MTQSITLETIQAFIYLVKQQDKSIFPEHLQSLSKLDQNLENLTSGEDFDVANVILDWCDNYPNIKKALREACENSKSTKDIVDRKEQIPSDINHQNEGEIINNKVLVRRVIQTTLKQQKKTANSENNG